MSRHTHICGIILAVFFIFPCSTSAATPNHGTVHAVTRSHYSKTHSLGDTYTFDPRDGWQGVNVTNLQYKYKRNVDDANVFEGQLERRGKKNLKGNPGKKGDKKSNMGGTFNHVFKDVWNGLKGIGKSQVATITWYTGHDLKNPSCWAESAWAPTDASFACALTLEGWSTRPQCFKFLELCNGPKKCVFVRVVDTCAGCAKGSKHIDLTRAAFGALAKFEQGTLEVNFRLATEPTGWFEDLWGPKAK